VLASPAPTEGELWRAAGVDLVQAPLEPYVEALARTLSVGEEAWA